MSLAAASATSAGPEQIEKPKNDPSHDRIETTLTRDDPRWNRSVRRQDLSGFIGTDLWMVSKYER